MAMSFGPAFFVLMLVVCGAVLVAVGPRIRVSARETGLLKNQGFAWAATAVMIVAAIGIGLAGSSGYRGREPAPRPAATRAPSSAGEAAAGSGYVRDGAGVLSQRTLDELEERNQRVYADMDVVIAVVTGNQLGNLHKYADIEAVVLNLAENDFLLVLDIEGRSGLLVQGSNLSEGGWFTDRDCTDYMTKYVLPDFNRGDYDSAVLSVTKALEEWYYDNY